jgi:transcriptional regulator GlxA family with amidase domain
MRRELRRPGPGTAAALAAVAYRLLLDLRPTTTPGGDRSADPLAVEARTRLDGALGSTVDIAGLARDLGVGRVALHRRFHAATGTSPLRYWQDLQVRRAQGLLIGSGLPVRMVAARLGYRDPLYFSRVFHRRTGLSPLAFRARHRSVE